MPEYDYRCQQCREAFTIERSMADDTEPQCVHCRSVDVSRIWSVPILATGSTPDVGQGTSVRQTAKKSGCGSCSTHSCGTCH